MKKILYSFLLLLSSVAMAMDMEDDFTVLFRNDTELSANWIGNLDGYPIQDGVIVSKENSGNIYTKKEYQDFIFRFEFKLPPGGNNGVGPRSPHPDDKSARSKDVAYGNFEIQILDDSAKQYENLKVWQFHGSAYGIAAAEKGALKPVGEWNSEEIYFKGTHLKITVNDKVILDTDIANTKPDDDYAKKLALGRNRGAGHIAFAGHGAGIEFRNVRVLELKDDYSVPQTADNTAPAGFENLFDGKSLDKWQGLLLAPYDKPHKRAELTPEKLLELQSKADEVMKKHWSITDKGELYFDGEEGGFSIATKEKYQNFEFHCSWKIAKNSDSGIYLRGLPQVQIWDTTNKAAFKHGADKGSGGLWNNTNHGKIPLVKADNPVGEWNHFYIRMIDDSVTIWLNGQLIVNDAPLQNVWEKGKPIPAIEQIELQCHGDPVWFKNIYIKKLPK